MCVAQDDSDPEVGKDGHLPKGRNWVPLFRSEIVSGHPGVGQEIGPIEDIVHAAVEFESGGANLDFLIDLSV